MEELLVAIEEAVAIADAIRAKYKNEMQSVDEVHAAMMKFTAERKVPDLCGKALEEHPEKKREIQYRLVAMFCEGKRLEDSLIG